VSGYSAGNDIHMAPPCGNKRMRTHRRDFRRAGSRGASGDSGRRPRTRSRVPFRCGPRVRRASLHALPQAHHVVRLLLAHEAVVPLAIDEGLEPAGGVGQLDGREFAENDPS
jgi:hypothetical protein